MRLPPIILASASPRRCDLLRELKLEFQVLPANTMELDSQEMQARELCQLNAYHKARAVAKKHPDSLVLGADTVVCLGSRIYGKPADLDDAHRILAELQGRTHEVVTGVCLLHLRDHRQRMFVETTLVTFRQLHAEQIKQYLSRINPLDKAGAYAIQEEGDEIVKQISGSYTNVVGLPLERLRQELDEIAAWFW